jgi:hypothetical protein
LTDFSTSLAVSVWDVLETAIATASSIGLKVKTNLDTTVSSRAPESGGNVAAIKAKTDQLAFTVANRVDANALQVGDKVGYSLSSAGIDAIWDQASILTLSFESLLTRLYQMINNKMKVTDATGVVTLRNIGDTSTIATGSVTDNLTETVRAELTWL